MLKKQDRYNIAVVGATGIVGESLLSILDSRSFPINGIHAVASQKSKGVKHDSPEYQSILTFHI